MKKTFSKLLITTIALWALTPSTFAVDLNALGGDTPATASGTASSGATTETATSTGKNTVATTATTEKTVSKIQIVTEVPSIPADGKKTINVVVQISDASNNSLSDTDVDTKAEIVWNDATNSLWVFSTGSYSQEDKYFKFSYTAWTKASEIQLKVTATSKTNKSNEVSQVEKLTLTEAVAETPVNTMTEPVTTTAETVTATGSDIMAEPTSEVKSESGTTSDIHIVKTEVLDLNRIKISFDNEIALSDAPLDMIAIESVKDKTKINLSNVTLWDDKKSLIVFSKDSLKKEEYHVIVNSVVDWKTMKAVSVANGTTTVSGMWELAILILSLLVSLGYVLHKRKDTI